MNFEPSSYQKAIFDVLEDPNGGNLCVEAVAGSGKTTTIVEALKRIPTKLTPDSLTSASVVFLAFNKNIAETLKTRCPSHVQCSTFHSLGFRALKTVLPANGKNTKVDGRKVSKLVFAECEYGDPDTNAIIKLVSLLKGTTDEPNEVRMEELATNFDVLLEDRKAAFRVAANVLAKSNADLNVIDFDDMLYLPLLLGASFSPQDWVFVDEAQDTNSVQIEILTRLRPKRLVAVGDPHQAIYGFRGAHSDSMSRIAERFQCKSLPLSVSYRCPQSIVLKAQAYVKHILFHDSAPLGEVKTLERYGPSDFPKGSLVLCRNTAPLVGLAYGLLQRDVPCKVLGREIGKALTSLITKLRATSLTNLREERLPFWYEREVQNALAEGRSVERIEDQYQCLLFFIRSLDEDSQSVSDLIAKIDLLFTDDPKNPGVTCGTIHKAKGLEFPTVFFLDRSLCPSKFARLPWQQEQEKNLVYVAITRAMETLVYINSGCWKETE